MRHEGWALWTIFRVFVGIQLLAALAAGASDPLTHQPITFQTFTAMVALFILCGVLLLPGWCFWFLRLLDYIYSE
jgi:hypothetical protein